MNPSTMTRWRRTALVAASAAAFWLAGCGSDGGGGGDAGGGPAPQTGPQQAAQVPFAALGSSARTVSLAWTPAADATTYAVERRRGSEAYARVALVDAKVGGYYDDGLDANTTYSYRLVPTGAGEPVAEKTATTSGEQGVVTARGAALGEMAGKTLGTAGGTLNSPDGQIAVEVPAGAYASDTATEATPVANTAPDGRGPGLKLRLRAAPSKPLTLKLKYDVAQDAEADAMRIAVQKPDGAWTSLPLLSRDKTTRTLVAQLPAEFVASSRSAALSAGKQPLADGDVSIEFHIVKYLAFYLAPKQALVKVKTTLDLVPYARVRGWQTEIGTCERYDDGLEVCVMQPMMETREVPFLNTKAGYTREWLVFADVGGNATYGTVTPRATVGATYRAPDVVPDPSTVTVTFASTHVASGRQMTLSALVAIWDDTWTGVMKAIDGPSDTGTSIVSTARVRWKLDSAASTAGKSIYRAEGEVEALVTDDDCTVVTSPSTQPVSTDTRLVELEVIETTTPMTYRARLITFWPGTISASCPRASATVTSRVLGWGWDVSGVVSADGRTIEGAVVNEEGHQLSWSFTR